MWFEIADVGCRHEETQRRGSSSEQQLLETFLSAIVGEGKL